MRTSIRIVTALRGRLRALLGTPPPDVKIVERADGEIVVWRSDESVTGVRLVREDGAVRIELPMFASPADISLAEGLAPLLANAWNGAIEIDGARVESDSFEAIFTRAVGEHVVRQTSHELSAILKSSVDAPRIVEIDGRLRPYFVGPGAGRRAMQLAGGDPSEGIARLLEIVASIQSLGDGTTFPKVHTIRTPDGVEARYARWDPRRETLLPWCEFVLVARDEPNAYIRVANDSISRLVERDDGSRLGAMVDERQWLLVQASAPDIERVLKRARELGRGLKLRLTD